MNKLLLTLAFLLVSGLSATNAQQTTESNENKKVVTHVSGNNYDVVFTDDNGKVFQKGQYYRIGDRFKPHGVWKLYDRNTLKLVTKAEYDKGEQLWVETIIDGEAIRVNQSDLKIKRLEERIATLEKKIDGIED